ncbi:RND family efflux transporter, MFP subunit [Longilinea arvoryzae]|uniref:RND family efflux transporter, MFP subunit n=1 Tax=Longilinea arvoryzae TaxID=360412 RepID=A0A0S7BCY0_9CHLR|nr:efflux RND transporter periplasmic adaptor subunit [Longilinea arvoryzae]GAP15566.1 RND family efflux transporter, MFP subunit [Longilinea arvoryzae]
MKRKTVITLVIIAVVLVGALLFYRSYRNAQAAASQNYQTAVVERGSLTAIVGATGTVRANQSAVLAWQTSGQVESIKVKLDEKVKQGQVLVSLSKGSLPQNVILAEADLVTAQRNLEDLKNSNVAASQAEMALLNAKTALEDAQKNRTSKQYGRASSDTIEAARASYYLAEDKVKKAQDFYNLFSSKPDNDLGRANALTLLAGAKRDRDHALANLNWLVGLPDTEEVTKADAQVKLAEAQVADAQRAYDRYKDGADPDEVRAAEAHVAALQATIDLARLEAPFAGTITELNSMVGDEVSMGSMAVRIDDLSHLLVDVQVPEIDINSIQVGQEARLTFDGIPNQEYTGKVTQVGRVGTDVAGAVNFNVTIELTNADEAVRPGMTAAVNVIVKQLNDVITVPNRAVRLLNGERVVYKLVNGKPQAVKITLGATADTNSEIASGDIKEGDTVILNPPSSFLNNMSGGGFMRGQ